MGGRPLRAAAALAVALLVVACGSSNGGGDARIHAVATVSPITNIVANIGGDAVRVTGIVPEGVNSHTFEPRPSDARLIAEADVIFMNGLNLEVPTEELARGNAGDDVEIVKLADEILDEDEWIFDFSFPRAGGDPNPHVWTNPPYALAMADVIRDRLSVLSPGDAAAFDRNFDAFEQRIDALDAAIRTATETVPAAQRKLLTYHDSFPYFAREYGWEIIGAIQPSDFSEPSPREVQRLIDQVRSEGVPAIFGSEVFPSPVLQRIADESGARFVAELRDDDLPGEVGDAEHSFLGLLVFDFRTIVEALGGDPSAFDDVETSNIAGESSVEYR